MHYLQLLFLWVVESSLAASVVILLVLAVQTIFRRYISPRLSHLLWLIVLIRLLVPVFPDSPVSIFNLFSNGQNVSESGMVIRPFTNIGMNHFQALDKQPVPLNPSIPEKFPSLETNEASMSLTAVGLKLFSAVWFLGTLVLSVYLGLVLWKTSRQRRLYDRVTDSDIISIVTQCREKLGIKQSVPVYTGKYKKSPYLSGLIDPWIYLPEELNNQLGANQLTHIIFHELAHLKRKDMMWNLIGGLVLTIHWFNPLVWVCLKQMRDNREIACDAYTLEILGETEAVPYGMTMIECLQYYSSKERTLSPLHFSNNLNHMKRRINMIKRFKKGSYRLSALAIVTALIIGGATLTNAGTTKNEDQLLFGATIFGGGQYANLEKGVKVSGFKYKVPAILPEGYKFDHIIARPPIELYSQEGNVSIRFSKRDATGEIGSFHFSAILDGPGIEAAYAKVKKGDERAREIVEEPLIARGLDGIKVTSYIYDWEKLTYIWKDQGIQYQLESSAELADQDMLVMIHSMKYPDKEMFEASINPYMITENIYDTDDLRRASESIGINLKFPVQGPGKFKAVTADESKKINFSYPVDEDDYWSKALVINYRKTKGEPGFLFKQIENNNIFEMIEAEGEVSFIRMDMEKNTIPVFSIEVNGKKVLVTEKYHADGMLATSPPYKTSYFWKENNVCYQLESYQDDMADEEIVSFFMNADYMDIKNLH
ncbi:hypothetical protein BEP19_00580 [Ammoniphilus oxalaticus]|uniref:Peptidase M56 domain-containing protein n=1 Tax=Ammoniphilus oxalaticus TaxID=66863 RepID=A0A419SRQ9_9BACL|nr:M56 family metallopeptidase [Ammoniphilus oxalaticus]RKD27101.1 hypothetical protein BEP19_00580 [Ammoniphilus oxalaticus]